MKWLSAFESKNTPKTKIKEIWLIAISKNVKKFNILKCFWFWFVCNVILTHMALCSCAYKTQIRILYFIKHKTYQIKSLYNYLNICQHSEIIISNIISKPWYISVSEACFTPSMLEYHKFISDCLSVTGCTSPLVIS